ncbi:MAG: hypothetical protein NC121_04970 [Blautia sp.]|nr:hypothetical protein [Blautia sp.]
MAGKIYRLHYRGQLKEDLSSEGLEDAVHKCMENVRRAQADGQVLTAALYRHERMLFFYYEALGEPLAVVEPSSLAGNVVDAGEAALTGHTAPGRARASSSQGMLEESGEDVQTTCARLEELLAPLSPFLQAWPGQKGDRLWAHMYHIYYHSVPESPEQWKRAAVPGKRRGRIAFLRDDKLFSYIYFHKAIVDEGLMAGDKYQSIALHENILFSYFEEPKTFVNVLGDDSRESRVINDWLAVDPESHFIHMPQGRGENFMFLPALFAMGVEDLR